MKRDIMKDAKYQFNYDRALYVNRDAKKAFSLAFIDDTPEEELSRRIEESTDVTRWTFYFNAVPSEGEKRELERVLG
jgi:hypothetical protein